MMEKKTWSRPEIGAVVFPANAYCAICEPFWQSTGINPSSSYYLMFEAVNPGQADAQNSTPTSSSYQIANNINSNPDNLKSHYSEGYFLDFIKSLMGGAGKFDADQIYGGGYFSGDKGAWFEPCKDPHTNVKEGDPGVYVGWYNTTDSSSGWQNALIWWEDDSNNPNGGRIHATTATWVTARS